MWKLRFLVTLIRVAGEAEAGFKSLETGQQGPEVAVP